VHRNILTVTSIVTVAADRPDVIQYASRERGALADIRPGIPPGFLDDVTGLCRRILRELTPVR
jgi:hypothetical protein